MDPSSNVARTKQVLVHSQRVATDVEQAVRVLSEGADRLRRLHHGCATQGLGFIASDPGLRRIGRID
jgi:hypothetical protein